MVATVLVVVTLSASLSPHSQVQLLRLTDTCVLGISYYDY